MMSLLTVSRNQREFFNSRPPPLYGLSMQLSLSAINWYYCWPASHFNWLYSDAFIASYIRYFYDLLHCLDPFFSFFLFAPLFAIREGEQIKFHSIVWFSSGKSFHYSFWFSMPITLFLFSLHGFDCWVLQLSSGACFSHKLLDFLSSNQFSRPFFQISVLNFFFHWRFPRSNSPDTWQATIVEDDKTFTGINTHAYTYHVHIMLLIE